MPTLPAFSVKERVNHSPHLVIVGAGASVAATPRGDRRGKRLPVMADFVDRLNLAPTMDRSGIRWRHRNFEDIYDELVTQGGRSEQVLSIENTVNTYFASLELPTEATIYDYLLLCLREKDAIATFNWDPFLAQAFARNAHLGRLPRIYFLHGNVAIGYCLPCKGKCFISDKCCPKCGKPLSATKLLYPVKNKDYSSDPFIRNEWKAVTMILERAYLLTIFGYSAPSGDAAAVELMKGAWEKNGTKELAQVEMVDIKSKRELHRTWSPFITRSHYRAIKSLLPRSLLAWHPRRSCEAIAFATLQNDPWDDNYIPRFRNLKHLQEWVKALIREEDDFEKSGTPLNSQPSR